MRTRIPWPRLWLLFGAAAVSMFTFGAVMLSDAPHDRAVQVASGLTAVILAALSVKTSLAELRDRRTNSKLDQLLVIARQNGDAIRTLTASTEAIGSATAAILAGLDERQPGLARSLRIDRQYFRDVLQALCDKTDEIADVDRRTLELIRDINDSGPSAALKL